VVAVGLLLAVGVYVLKGNAAQSSQEKPVMATSEGPQTKGTSSVPSALRDRFDQVSRQVYQAVEPIVREGDDALLSSAVSVNPATIAAHYQRVEVAESQVAQAAAKWSSGTVPDLCPDEYKILGERYQQLRDALRNYGVSVRNLRNAYARTDFDMSQPLERFAETERSELGRDRMVLENTWRDTRQAESRFRDCTGL
jgi:serine/threonine-protein kinase